MSKLENIEAFIKVAEKGGYAAAAKNLNLTRAALSKQIINLEKRLGNKLIERTNRYFRLTPVGEAYLKECREIVERLNAADELVRNESETPGGTVKIAASRYFASAVIIPHLAEFQQQYPNIHLELEVTERFVDVVREDIDLIIGFPAEGPADLVRRLIAMTRMVFVASPEYLETMPPIKNLGDFHKQKFIMHKIRANNYISLSDGTTINVTPAYIMNDLGIMRDAVLNGLGIARIQYALVHKDIKEGRLVHILPETLRDEMGLYLFYQKTAHLQQRVRVFIDFFVDKAQVYINLARANLDKSK